MKRTNYQRDATLLNGAADSTEASFKAGTSAVMLPRNSNANEDNDAMMDA